MKNLKKVLALVLVVATLMSFATVASATFTDADKVEKTEAVDVMSAIGIINGYTDGSFRPEGNVTRAEMAKMVTMLISGGEDVGDLYTGANVFSDCTTHWAKGYIAYANKMGIVAGVGGGKFNPNGNVTGAQAAKMMLVALGYKSDVEQYTGSQWSVNVLADARAAGLFNGLEGVNMAAPLSREDAAQMMFNTLQATMVAYEGGTNITTGDGTSVVVDAKRYEVVNRTTSYHGAADGVMQFCEQYFDKLQLSTIVGDDMGRPSNQWSYKATVVGNYAETPVLTYTATVKEADVAKDLKAYNLTDGVLTTNGVPGAADSADTAAEIAAATGNGTVVEIFANSSNQVTAVVKSTPVLAKVSAVNNTKKTVTLTPAAGGTAFAVIDEDNSLYADVKGLDVDSYVVVTYKDAATDVITSVTAPKTVTGTASAKNATKNTVTVGGTTYESAAAYTGLNAAITDLGTTTYTLYLDEYGYVLFAEAGTSANVDYAYAINYSRDGSVKDGYTYNFKVVMLDGTTSWIEVSKYDGASLEKDSAVSNMTGDDMDDVTVDAGVIISYTKLDDGTYDIVKATNNADTGVTIAKNSTTMTSSGVKANNNTVFLFQNNDDTFTPYVGIKNLPASEVTGASIVSNVADSKYAGLVIVKSGTKSASSADITYIIEAAGQARVNGQDVYAYNALVNGELKTIYCVNNTAYTAGNFYSALTYDDSEYGILSANSGTPVTAIADEASTDYYWYEAGTSAAGIVLKNGILTVDTDEFAVNDDFTVYFINTADSNALTDVTLGASNIFTAGAKALVTTEESGIATAIYIVGAMA